MKAPMTNTPISDATPHNVGDLGMLCRKLERDLRKREAGAAVMREALKLCDNAFAKFCPDPESRYGTAWAEVESALATNAGRELLAEVERLRKDAAEACEVCGMSAWVENEDGFEDLCAFCHERDEFNALRSELERLRFELAMAQIPTTVDAVEREEWRQERDTLRRKVAAAEGLATALAMCAKIPVCVYPEGLYIDLEEHTAVIAALAAWKEANK